MQQQHAGPLTPAKAASGGPDLDGILQDTWSEWSRDSAYRDQRPSTLMARTRRVFHPWPHQGTSIILGQIGFMENFTVTFGPDHSAVPEGRPSSLEGR